MRTILKDKELFRWTKAKDTKPKTYGYTVNGSKTVELQNPSGYSIYNFLIDGSSHKDIYVKYLHEGLYELNFFLEKVLTSTSYQDKNYMMNNNFML